MEPLEEVVGAAEGAPADAAIMSSREALND